MTISPRYRQQLVVMVKEPRPGRVKTRLGRDLGMTTAAWWFRHQVRRLLRDVTDPRWDVVLSVAPDTDGLTSRVWPTHLPRIPQGTGDLGDRMGRIFHMMPNGPVIIIGADIPGVTRQHINKAFRALGNHDAVFGPAMDGGYWLVGLKRVGPVPTTLFHGVRWSGENTLSDTCETLGCARIALVDEMQDVDTIADLVKRRSN